MNKFKKFIVALGVFTMMIGSGFAMDNNPPTEPVKAIVDTEAVEEAPQQTQYMGLVAYKDAFGNCINIPNPMHCTTTVGGPRCTIKIAGIDYDLFTAVQDPLTLEWSCNEPLYEIPNPF